MERLRRTWDCPDCNERMPLAVKPHHVRTCSEQLEARVDKVSRARCCGWVAWRCAVFVSPAAYCVLGAAARSVRWRSGWQCV